MPMLKAICGHDCDGCVGKPAPTHDVSMFRDKWEGTRKETSMFREKGLVQRSVFETHGPSFNQFAQVALDIAHSEQKGAVVYSAQNLGIALTLAYRNRRGDAGDIRLVLV